MNGTLARARAPTQMQKKVKVPVKVLGSVELETKR